MSSNSMHITAASSEKFWSMSNGPRYHHPGRLLKGVGGKSVRSRCDEHVLFNFRLNLATETVLLCLLRNLPDKHWKWTEFLEFTWSMAHYFPIYFLLLPARSGPSWLKNKTFFVNLLDMPHYTQRRLTYPFQQFINGFQLQQQRS